jgi:hypothetical protein
MPGTQLAGRAHKNVMFSGSCPLTDGLSPYCRKPESRHGQNWDTI